MARGAKSLITLRDQINTRFPYRDKASDGGIGDAAHSMRISDHNADKNGVYHAYDYDHDPDANGLNCVTLKRELVQSGDRRIKYIIFQRKIWYPSGREYNYTGTNAHTLHLHLSVVSGIGDLATKWNLPMLGSSVPVAQPPGGGAPQTYGLTEAQTKQLQNVMNRWYPDQIKLVVDGDYGPRTVAAVKYVQQRFKIEIDGIAGPITRRKLGIKF